MTNANIADRIVLLEVALGAMLRALPVESAQEVRAALAEHLAKLPSLNDDEDAAVAGVVARLTGLT